MNQSYKSECKKAGRKGMTFGIKCAKSILSFVILLSAANAAFAQSLFEMPEGVESRWASGENPTGEKGKAGQANGGRKGAPTVAIKAGASRVLAEAAGTSGTVRRIWMTFPERSPRMLRSLRIDIDWDGAKRPAVSARLGDFFGIGLGQTVPFQSALFSNPEGRSFNCVIPMPFKTGMKIVMTNESAANLDELFYDVDYTLGDKHGAGVLYFHAHYRRENPTRLKQDYELLPLVTGRGRGQDLSGRRPRVPHPERDRLGGLYWHSVGPGPVRALVPGQPRRRREEHALVLLPLPHPRPRLLL